MTKVGLDCKMFHNTGTYAIPVWNEVEIVKDASLNIEIGTADASRRASFWRQFLTTLSTGGIEFNLIADTASDNYNTFRDAAINRTVLDIALCEGPMTTGNQYFRADHLISAFNRGEPLEDVCTVDCTTVLAYSNNTPIFVTVS